MKRLVCLALASSLFNPDGARALDTPEIFREADLQQGERLLEENRCAACHAQKFGGDGSAIYRPAGRVNSPGMLRGMVEQCNLNLKLGLFPDEVTDISAVLNRDHYHFKR
jgi:hypothetical protein